MEVVVALGAQPVVRECGQECTQNRESTVKHMVVSRCCVVAPNLSETDSKTRFAATRSTSGPLAQILRVVPCYVYTPDQGAAAWCQARTHVLADVLLPGHDMC